GSGMSCLMGARETHRGKRGKTLPTALRDQPSSKKTGSASPGPRSSQPSTATLQEGLLLPAL
ncbi:Hypothetical predicted protein, partial [Pelobates cultripes]